MSKVSSKWCNVFLCYILNITKILMLNVSTQYLIVLASLLHSNK